MHRTRLAAPIAAVIALVFGFAPAQSQTETSRTVAAAASPSLAGREP